MTTVRIIIMAKAPVPGFAKTRLIPALGEQGAADLALGMLLRTLESALGADTGPVELCVTPIISDPAWQGIPIPPEIAVSAQGPGDLGERMARVASAGIARGEKLVLVGTDCVQMSAALLREAASALSRADVVLHPTADGGYALLGLSRFDGEIFRDIPWSTSAVARMTRERIDALGWRLRLGTVLHDIDEPADLVHWTAERAGPRGT